EVEHAAGPETSPVLDEMMAVEHQGLNAGEQAFVAIQVGPAGLHHADLRIAEISCNGFQKIRTRDEVGVEDRDELALRALEAVLRRAGLVADAVRTADVDRVEPTLAQLRDLAARQCLRLVRRIVEHLELELVRGVVE